MSVLNRVRQKDAETTGDRQLADQYSTLLAEANPVLGRLNIVLKQMSAFIKQQPQNKFSRYAWLLDEMMTEVLDEIASQGGDTSSLGDWFEQFGKIVEWCGSGDDSVLPDSVREYLANRQGNMLALTSGKE